MTLSWLPNAITITRCVLAIVVGYTILDMGVDLRAGRAAGPWLFLPFALYLLTAGTDWLDGMLARRLNAQSEFGSRLDPIADKLLTASCLFALCHLERWAMFISIPSLTLVGRDFLLTAMRESLGNPAGLKVSQLAKWKTAIALVSIGAVLLGMAVSEYAHYADQGSPSWLATRGLLITGLAGIWVAAILAVVTAWDYVAAAGQVEK